MCFSYVKLLIRILNKNLLQIALRWVIFHPPVRWSRFSALNRLLPGGTAACDIIMFVRISKIKENSV
jgi:hypothetical protein